MGNAFNKCTQPEDGKAPIKSKPKANDHDKAVLQLKVARDKVSKFKKKANDAPICKPSRLFIRCFFFPFSRWQPVHR